MPVLVPYTQSARSLHHNSYLRGLLLGCSRGLWKSLSAYHELMNSSHAAIARPHAFRPSLRDSTLSASSFSTCCPRLWCGVRLWVESASLAVGVATMGSQVSCSSFMVHEKLCNSLLVMSTDFGVGTVTPSTCTDPGVALWIWVTMSLSSDLHKFPDNTTCFEPLPARLTAQASISQA